MYPSNDDSAARPEVKPSRNGMFPFLARFSVDILRQSRRFDFKSAESFLNDALLARNCVSRRRCVSRSRAKLSYRPRKQRDIRAISTVIALSTSREIGSTRRQTRGSLRDPFRDSRPRILAEIKDTGNRGIAAGDEKKKKERFVTIDSREDRVIRLYNRRAAMVTRATRGV